MKFLLSIVMTLLPTLAFSQTVSAERPQSLADALRAAGYGAVLAVDEYGDPQITSWIGEVEYDIYFYGCDGNYFGCQDILFSAGFDLISPLSAEYINNWNVDALAGTAYIDDEGDPFLTMFIPGATDLTEESFDRMLAAWEGAFTGYLDFIGWN
jgi:hypothetical protein